MWRVLTLGVACLCCTPAAAQTEGQRSHSLLAAWKQAKQPSASAINAR